MTFREAVRAAYEAACQQGNCVAHVVRQADGEHYWFLETSPQVMAPEAGSKIVWRHNAPNPIDNSEATEEEWEQWLDFNAVEA